MVITVKKYNWRGILIHHSGDPDDYGLDFDDELDFHTQVKLWSDLGYHGLNEEVEGQSVNIIGRPLTMQGAHCRDQGMNSQALGFCFVGNFSLKFGPSDERINDAVRRVIVPWMIYNDIPIERVRPHRYYAKTECPGNYFRWNTLIGAIKSGLQH